ncbi:Exonuclease SbcC [Candidatus Burkholderia verschuerenii]|uniref:Exonuclease SbcC n=1 Tax=Candidatus Burkholderia verschuerenii TaxID=242163 RepID=A0A0L0M7U9_9BURK|nr:nuclease SbcCD subunit C [Candidatus Burkholderia verschuerenii]KND58054.1 Exonuclease SbcC [Candidatus Burkholderia verschuerenii]
MRPLKLTLEGFVGVRDGMKRDCVTLDLESLPDGLIALSGPNGAGKTTIMDNLHPYPIMPSRASKLSVDAFSYWDHICGTSALKELEWEHDGIRYRSSFTFRKPGKTGKAEYYLAYRGVDNTWRPVSLPDGTVSDGKAESYNRCVEAINGSLETFFTSVFSAQNRRPLASYGAGEIKMLLAELLGIEHLKALSVKAGDVAKVLGKSLDSIQSELVALAGKRQRKAEVERSIAAQSAALSMARAQREDGLSQAGKLTQERATLAAKQSESASVEARLRELGVRRAELTKAMGTAAEDERVAGARNQQRLTALNRTIATHQATLASREAILGAATKREEAELAIAREDAKIAPLQREIVELEAKQATLNALNVTLATLQSEGGAKKAHLGVLNKQAAVVDQVPCVGHAMHATCPLLSQALHAKQQAATYVVSVTDLREKYRAKLKDANELGATPANLAAKRVEMLAITDELAKLRRALQAATELAASKPLLDAATSGLEAAQAECRSIAEEGAARTAKFESEKIRMSADLARIAEEAMRLAAVDVTAAIAKLDRDLAGNREVLASLEGRIEALIRSQSVLQAEGESLAVELEKFSATQSRADRLSDEIARWKLLAKALGNDGVIALTIDDAGPALTHMVNELLLACYGMRFTVEIRTQRALATGELREGFEIIVHDADTDSSKSVSVMSGGQKVWINECLTRGIALYLAQNTGQPYQTLFSDESDGPLDPQRKVQFMSMKREVLRQGGYQREFFISQTPELVAEADAVIDVQALVA